MKKLISILIVLPVISCMTISQKYTFGDDLKKMYPEYKDNTNDYLWSSSLNCIDGDSVFLYQVVNDRYDYIGQLHEVINLHGQHLYVDGVKFKSGVINLVDNSGCDECKYISIYYDKSGVFNSYSRVNEKYFQARTHVICDNKGMISSVSYFSYDFEADSSTYTTVTYPHHGNGYWKDYYYTKAGIKSLEIYDQVFDSDVADTVITYKYRKFLKKEGAFKNNYKVGEWKYYNKDGTIREIRNYKKRDKVDVRFPYCLFNRKEPCYCDE